MFRIASHVKKSVDVTACMRTGVISYSRMYFVNRQVEFTRPKMNMMMYLTTRFYETKKRRALKMMEKVYDTITTQSHPKLSESLSKKPPITIELR
jgi:hypothetical protein